MRRAMTMLILLSMLGGCVTATFKEPVGKFTTAMSTANASIGTYFVRMNDFEREVYLDDALYDPTKEVTYGGPTKGLAPIFSAASIQARMDAVSLLQAYGEKLAAVAGSKAPDRFQAGSEVLGTNLSKLADRFTTLSTGAEPDKSAGAYVGPVSTIIGAFGRMVLEAKRDAAFKKAVNDAAPSVNAILAQLDADLTTVIDPLIETGEAQALFNQVQFYNVNRAKMTFEQRETLLKKIDAQTSRYQMAITARPAEAVDGIRDAHAALVTYTNSARNPKDLSSLVEAIETFNTRLEPVVNAINKLREARRAV